MAHQDVGCWRLLRNSFTEEYIWHYFKFEPVIFNPSVCDEQFRDNHTPQGYFPICPKCLAYTKEHDIESLADVKDYRISFDMTGDLSLLMHHILTLGEQHWRIIGGESQVNVTLLKQKFNPK